jgi:hypothetical protein
VRRCRATRIRRPLPRRAQRPPCTPREYAVTVPTSREPARSSRGSSKSHLGNSRTDDRVAAWRGFVPS